jgi:bifunctional DNase/RNase
MEMDRNGFLVQIDARPSHSIVMPSKFDSPLYVTKPVFEAMAIPIRATNDLDDPYGLALQELTEPLAEYFSFGSTRGYFFLRYEKEASPKGWNRGGTYW